MGDADAINAVGATAEAAGDFQAALANYQRAADMSHREAQCNLGHLYEKGLGTVAQDAVIASRWYRAAADAGFAKAQNNLGSLYYGGEGVGVDHGAAAFWYEKAAAQGNASALNNLGIMYEDGLVDQTGGTRPRQGEGAVRPRRVAGTRPRPEQPRVRVHDERATRGGCEAFSERVGQG